MNQNNPYPPPAEGALPAPPPMQAQVAFPTVKPYVSYVVLGLTVLTYLMQMASEFLWGIDYPAVLGMKANLEIVQGQYWRMLTPMFLHGSILHIAFNMYALSSFGPALERHFGHWRFLLLYVLSGITGNLASFVFSEAYSLGSSTAIFGLLGAEMVFLYQNRRLLGSNARRVLGNIATVAVINLIIGLSPGIDNWGHIGGLIGGALFSWFGGPALRLEGIFPSLSVIDDREPRTAFLVGLGIFVVVLLIAALVIQSRLGPAAY